jgi:hypothetical protein
LLLILVIFLLKLKFKAMSNLLNTLVSTDAYGNSGIQATYFSPDEIVGAILVPKDWKIDSTYLGTNGISLKTNMQADTRKTIGDRIFPIFSFGGITDNSAESKYQTFGYGSERKASDGKYTWTFDLLQGGISLIKNLRKFKSSDYDVLFCTRDSYLIGTGTGTTGEMKGVTCDLMDVFPWKAPDGTNATGLKIKFSLSLGATKELNEDVAYIKTDFDIETNVKGLINVTLSDVGTQSTTHIYVGAKTNEGDVNLYSLYGADLAKPTAWIYKTAAGVVTAISAAAVYAAGEGFDLTGTFLTGTTITIQLETPTALAALSPAIGAEPSNGLESDILSIAIP